MESSRVIDGRLCHCFTRGASDTAFLLGLGRAEADYARRVFDLCCEKTEAAFTLFAYECDDWFGDYSPWEAPADPAGQCFPGGAAKTLAFLLRVREELRAEGISRFYPTGYSLSGLFALYAFCETGLFDGAIACSASFWYPGLIDYVHSRPLRADCAIYLSLGGKEERSAPDYMKSVGENARRLCRLFRQDARVRAVTLEMNPGGHFAPSEPRLSKGILWTLANA